jgi:hypothetical protein
MISLLIFKKKTRQKLKNRYNTTPHASPEAALYTGRRPQGRHHNSTQQAEVKDRSQHSNNHTGPRVAPRLAEDELASAKTTKTLHRSLWPVVIQSEASRGKATQKGHPRPIPQGI